MKLVAVSKGYISINPDELLTLKNTNFYGESFSGKKLRDFTVINCQLENCHFKDMRFEQACFGAGRTLSTYINCSFDNLNFAASVVGRARFVNCSFSNVNIKQFFAHDAEFIDCLFTGKLKKALFYGKVLEGRQETLGRDYNEFHGNDFSGLEMSDVGFRKGIDLRQQKLPQKEGYLYIENLMPILRQARVAIADWTDASLKRKAEIIIQIQEEKLAEGQQQLFLIKKDIEPEIFDLFRDLAN